MRIYLDHNATTPLRPEVIEAMAEVLGQGYGNPSSTHAEGNAARRALETARGAVAECIAADAERGVFDRDPPRELIDRALRRAVWRVVAQPTTSSAAVAMAIQALLLRTRETSSEDDAEPQTADPGVVGPLDHERSIPEARIDVLQVRRQRDSLQQVHIVKHLESRLVLDTEQRQGEVV